MAQSIPFEVLAKTLYEEAIAKFPTEDWVEIIKKEKISCDDKRIEWEAFYLWIFLLTFSFQRKYAHLGNEKARRILDAIHEQIYSPSGRPGFSEGELIGVRNIIAVRYAQYYKAIKSDLDTMQKGVRGIIFSELTDAFLLNLINKDTKGIELQEYQKFTKFKVLAGIFIAELYKLFLDWFEKNKSRYEIKFD